MALSSKANDIDVVILCGGLGTRLSPFIKNQPKAMVEIGGRPFLDLLIEYISSSGYKRFILCTGHKSNYIENYYKNKNDSLEYVFSIEQNPLGTAGAVKNAEPLIKSNPFLCFNGDSFCAANLKNLLDFHVSSKLIASITVTSAQEQDDYGSVQLNENNEIIKFDEKNPSKNSRLVNAGIYVFDKEVFRHIPSGQSSSLEHDIFPRLIKKGVSGFHTHQPLFDIGTPERLEFAKINLLKFI